MRERESKKAKIRFYLAILAFVFISLFCVQIEWNSTALIVWRAEITTIASLWETNAFILMFFFCSYFLRVSAWDYVI